VSVSVGYRHVEPGLSLVCVSVTGTPGATGSVTVSGPGGGGTQSISLAGGSAGASFPISAYGPYEAAATVSLGGLSASGGGSVNVTPDPGSGGC
jgi:hypothetical protein